MNLWIVAFFTLGLLFNIYWYRRVQNKKIKSDYQAEKVKHQTNLIKIQRYAALNELGKTLARTFKTQDTVVLLIETVAHYPFCDRHVQEFLAGRH